MNSWILNAHLHISCSGPISLFFFNLVWLCYELQVAAGTEGLSIVPALELFNQMLKYEIITREATDFFAVRFLI